MSKKQLADPDKNKLKESWREVRLGDISEIIKDSWKIGDNDEKYIGLEHIEEGTLRLNGVGCSEQLMSNKYRFKSGDILFGKLRPYFRKVIVPSFDGICSTDIWVIRAKNLAHQKYLFYFLANPIFIAISMNSNAGTRMPRADWEFLKDTKWPIPPLLEQEGIAEVLSSLDDKIDLLHRQTKTLENLAQTLFRQWFVKEANGDWEEKKLSTLVEFIKGRKPQKTEGVEFESSLPQILIETFDTGETLFAKQEGMAIVNKRDTLMVMDGASSGRVELGFEGIAGSTIGIFKPLDNFNYPFFIHSFLKPKEKYVKKNVTGSAIPHADRKMVLSLSANFPNISKVAEFELIATSQFARIFKNRDQIKTLKNIRDTLLPKLMNGNLRFQKW